ncbi:MAG: radical SAM protein [Candidatus Caldatribacterium sp.]|nr:radical SAM protein [Candidatus Caldatribacterium sp.]
MQSVEEKFTLLSAEARFDLCGSCFRGESRIRRPQGGWIYPVVLPNGERIPVLKVLLSNVCVHGCLYCANRVGRPSPRATFTAEELSRLFMDLHRRGLVQGLFLSSAVFHEAPKTMAEMIKVVELLRFRYRFLGYVHLKVLPGVGYDFAVEAARLATRVSVNLEAPSAEYLRKIAPEKDFARILEQFSWFKRLQEEGVLRGGFTTQFVVGAAGEKDQDILKRAAILYRDFRIQRVYYSAFQPVPGTPLEEAPPVSTWREHRLYQADFLLRHYGFSYEEIPFEDDGNLSIVRDPKTVWALRHPECFPVELSQAPYEVLLRVPGIGPKTARKILRLRQEGVFITPEGLQKLSPSAGRALPFLLFRGKRVTPPHQLSLFPEKALL